MTLLSTAQVAERLGVKPQRVLQFVAEGRLRGQKVGNSWAFREREVARFEALPRVDGRPKKS